MTASGRAAARRLRLVAALGAALLCGCTIRLGYPLLDTALMWSLGDYIDWEGGQKRCARALIRELHDWHRRHELPRYARDLRTLANDLEGRLDDAAIARHAEALTASWREVTQRLAGPAATLLGHLAPHQTDALLATLAEQQQLRLRDHGRKPAAEHRRERADAMTRGIERISGRLRPDQRQLIAAWSAALPDAGEQSLAQQATWREQFAAALDGSADPAQLQRALAPLFGEPQSLWSDAYRQQMAVSERLTVQLLADLADSLSAEQRRRTTQRLRAIAADLDALSATPAAATSAAGAHPSCASAGGATAAAQGAGLAAWSRASSAWRASSGSLARARAAL